MKKPQTFACGSYIKVKSKSHSADHQIDSFVKRVLRPEFLIILRKEVIQPQVPLRLPCYDLVPIAKFIFGA